MKRFILTIAGAATAAALIPATASAAPVCTSVNKGGATAERKIVVSSCRDYSGLRHREYGVLYIGSASTRATDCKLYLSTVEVAPNGAPVHWQLATERYCHSALRSNTSIRYWGIDADGYYSDYAKTVACLYLDGRKLGSCVYSPALRYRYP
jgi:hypothetical protein